MSTGLCTHAGSADIFTDDGISLVVGAERASRIPYFGDLLAKTGLITAGPS